MAVTASSYEWRVSMRDTLSAVAAQMGRAVESAMLKVVSSIDPARKAVAAGIADMRNVMASGLGAADLSVPIEKASGRAIAYATDIRTVAEISKSVRAEMTHMANAERSLMAGFVNLADEMSYTAARFGSDSAEMSRSVDRFVESKGGIDGIRQTLAGLAEKGQYKPILDAFEAIRKGAGGMIPTSLQPLVVDALQELRGKVSKGMFAGILRDTGLFSDDMVALFKKGNDQAIDQAMRAVAAAKAADPGTWTTQMASAIRGVNTTPFMDNMRGIGEGLKSIGSDVASAFRPISNQVQSSLISPMRQHFAAFKSGLAAFWAGLTGMPKAPQQAAPAGGGGGGGMLGGLTKQFSLGGVAAALGPMMAAIGPITLLVEALQPVIDALKGALMPLLTPLANMLLSVVSALQPVIDALMPIVQGVFSKLTPLFTMLADTVAAIVVPVLNMLTPILLLVAQLVTDLLTPLLPLVQVILRPLVMLSQLLGPPLQMIGMALRIALLPFTLLGKVLESLSPIMDTWMTLITQTLNPMQRLVKAMSFFVDTIMGIVDSIFGGIQPIIDGFLAAFTAIGDAISGFVKDTIQPVVDWFLSIKTAVSDAWGAVIGKLRKIPLIGRFFGKSDDDAVASGGKSSGGGIATSSSVMPSVSQPGAASSSSIVPPMPPIQIAGAQAPGGQPQPAASPSPQQRAVSPAWPLAAFGGLFGNSNAVLAMILKDSLSKIVQAISRSGDNGVVAAMNNARDAIVAAIKDGHINPEVLRRFDSEVLAMARGGAAHG